MLLIHPYRGFSSFRYIKTLTYIRERVHQELINLTEPGSIKAAAKQAPDDIIVYRFTLYLDTLLKARDTTPTMAAVPKNQDTLNDLCVALERNAGDLLLACQGIGRGVGWVRQWMREDPKVEAAINDATVTGVSVLEHVLLDRAVNGYKEEVYYKDEMVGYKTKISSSDLHFALGARKREMYGKQVEINTNINVRHMADDELDAKITLLADRLGVQLALPAPTDIIDAEFSEVALEVDDLL